MKMPERMVEILETMPDYGSMDSAALRAALRSFGYSSLRRTPVTLLLKQAQWAWVQSIATHAVHEAAELARAATRSRGNLGV